MSKLLAFITLAVAARQVASVAIDGQCGGIGWTGGTTCDSGSVCTYMNPYYSQCLPGSATATTVPAPSSTVSSTPSGTGLNGKLISHGKKFWGVYAGPSDIATIPAIATILKSDFGAVTPLNTMMWDATENVQNQFTYSGSDALVAWATSNGKMIRGYTLVWHSQLPTWVSNINNPTTLTAVIDNHISNLVGRYKGKFYAVCRDWDVVNEILNDDGTLASQIFYNVLGEGFVAMAFTAARQADGGAAKLYINDFNMDSNNAKVQGMVALVKRVNANGTLIDGIGTQMHLGPGGAGGAQAALNALATSGCEVAITELEIAGAASSDYTAVVKACLNTPQCVSITSMGVSGTSLLWDSSYRPKAAYSAVIAAM